MFDLDKVRAAGLVASIDFHDVIGSTSDRALELAARDDAPLPLLVLAESQTAGRGRGTNRWWSKVGALTFSLVLHAPADRLPPHRWSQVSLVAGLAVCEALQALAPTAELRLKWPNDVFLAGAKVCGILTESVPGWRDRLVIGVGINANNTLPRGQAEPFAHAATSLAEHDGQPRDLTAMLLAVLDEFDRRWQTLLSDGFAVVAGQYRRWCLLTGKTLTIEEPGGRRVVGRAQGIDDEGALVVVTEAARQRVVAGSVVAWDDAA